MQARGFDIERDAGMSTYARELLPARYAFRNAGDRHIALARRANA
jgi:hypothetical protein